MSYGSEDEYGTREWFLKHQPEACASERAAIVEFIRQRAAMADALMRFGGQGGGVLHGLADEIEAGEEADE